MPTVQPILKLLILFLKIALENIFALEISQTSLWSKIVHLTVMTGGWEWLSFLYLIITMLIQVTSILAQIIRLQEIYSKTRVMVFSSDTLVFLRRNITTY